MLLQRQGYPADDEFVLCTVTKVQFHSVFVVLDEFKKSGMIHISEVSPGRIRNIRDFVKEGKKVVCKVLRVNKERGHIDLSLRRVTEAQKRNKLDEIKQQQKAEKILENVARECKTDVKKLFSTVQENIAQQYGTLYAFFQAIVADNSVITDAGLDKKQSDVLLDMVKTRVKESTVTIEGKLHLTTYDPEGISVIKKALSLIENVDKENVSLKYLGAGTYGLRITAKNYKDAEKLLKQATDHALDHLKKHEGAGEFIRTET